MMQKLIIVCIFALFISLSLQDSVCDEDTLIAELKQDIADNGQLDCLRTIREPNPDVDETDDQKMKRIAAVWDSDCSFEAEYNWLKQLKEVYQLRQGLVDVDGNVVDGNNPLEADMCEIVRALLSEGMMAQIDKPVAEVKKVNIKSIVDADIDLIDCAGDSTIGQSEICAVNGGFGMQTYGWIILLDGKSVQFNEAPIFIPAEDD